MDTAENTKLKPYLSPLNVWALSFGCAVGWGAFVMPGTTFLPIAGPLGTALGMAVGGIIMLIIGYNYHFMMNKYPDAGGTYSYAKNVFGKDHGFLVSWFLILIYLAILWANSSAFVLLIRYTFGNVLQFGFCYTVFGYDIYLGELLFSIIITTAICLLCAFKKKVASITQIIFSSILIVGVIFTFIY